MVSIIDSQPMLGMNELKHNALVLYVSTVKQKQEFQDPIRADNDKTIIVNLSISKYS